MTDRPLQLKNGSSVDESEVPVMSGDKMREHVVSSVGKGSRIAAMFGSRVSQWKTKIYVVLVSDHSDSFDLLATLAGDSFKALTPECPQAHLFEREIYEQTGVKPEGHPWLKPVRGHQSGSQGGPAKNGHEFFRMHGDETHEVAVGPVHAGVIEPGHFRFQCHGEVVHHLEIHLGYQSRGVEESMQGGPYPRSLLQMETVAGDTSIAHATAYCLVMEALGDIAVPGKADVIRTVALELERLANHVGDLGALANDIGFLPAASYCGRLRGDFLNMTAMVCGSQFGRRMVRPGGSYYDITGELSARLMERLDAVEPDVEGAVGLLFDTESCRGRLESTGTLSTRAAMDLGVVGLAARASGLPVDARMNQPSAGHGNADFQIAVGQSGDVLARAVVRRQEVRSSFAILRELLGHLPDAPFFLPLDRLSPGRLALGMVEGWRGEVVHVAITDNVGKFARYKIVDPSFHNWTGLALAMRGEQISDFPLCNKSFNLSYCGFDL